MIPWFNLFIVQMVINVMFARVSQIECDNSGRPPSTECLQYYTGDSGTFQVPEKSFSSKGNLRAKPNVYISHVFHRAGIMMGQQFTTQPKARFLQMICSSQSKIKRKNSELWDLHPPRGGFLWNPICSGRWAVEVKFQIQKYSNRNPICSGRWTISRNISNKRGELSKKITPPAINMKVYIWPSWENTFPFRKLKVKWIFSTKITAVFIQFHMGLPRLRRRGQGRSVWTNQCQPNLHLREELSRVENELNSS